MASLPFTAAAIAAGDNAADLSAAAARTKPTSSVSWSTCCAVVTPIRALPRTGTSSPQIRDVSFPFCFTPRLANARVMSPISAAVSTPAATSPLAAISRSSWPSIFARRCSTLSSSPIAVW